MDVKEFLVSQKARFVPVRDLLQRMADAGGCSEREAASALSSCLKQAGEGAPAWYEYGDYTGPIKIDKNAIIGRAFFMLEELACRDEDRMYDPHIPRDAVWGVHGDEEYDLIHFGVCKAYQDYGFLAAEIYNLLGHNRIDLAGAGLKADPPEAPERQEANVPTHPRQADTPQLIPSRRIAAAFAGMGGRDEEQWKSVLADPPNWLEAARRKKGRRGPGNAAMWDPVVIALHLMERGAPRPKLDTVFKSGPFQEWQPYWQEHAE